LTNPARRRPLAALVRDRWPQLDESAVLQAIGGGDVVVDGAVVTNPRSLVAAGASVRLAASAPLQGQRKLAWALSRFPDAVVGGRVVLDLGACTGGFTSALLAAGAARVYAVDAGFGQLRGALAQDPRVVNLERTNVGALSVLVVPDAVGAVTVDVSYLSLSAAVTQLSESLRFEDGADLLGLVKPMFELRLATIPSADDRATLSRAVEIAVAGVGAAGWTVLDSDECPVRGARGAVEFFVHARR
jgi:23S rRNA (cytidine1920-2'-O)/16S rRNA (cytidine1409-2'-O)-methyltransferase